MTEVGQQRVVSMSPSGRLPARGIFFTLAIAAAALLVLFLGWRVAERMSVLQAAPQDNVQWTLAQIDVELLAFEVAVREGNADQVRKRFDVFYSRVNTVSALPLFRDHEMPEEAAANLASIKASLDGMARIIDGSDESLHTQLFALVSETEKLRPLAREVTLSGVKAHASSSDLARGDLARVLRQTALVNTFLILGLAAALLFLFRQISISRRKATEVEAESARNAATVNASLDAIIVIDLDGKIVEFNPAAVQTFGYTRNAAIGSRLEDLIIPERYKQAHRAGMKRFRETGERKVIGAGRVELAALNSVHGEFPIEMSLALSDSPQGQIVTAFLRDISRRVQQQTDLRRARDEALQASQVKSQFLAVMSHEMRTPLNGVMALLDLLVDTRLNTKQKSYVKTASASADILKQHIDDVLDLTRLQAGKLELMPRAFDLLELLEEVQSLNLATAAKRDNRLTLMANMPEPYFIADRKRLHQVLTNLVSNAIKFTENGRIGICARFHDVKADVVTVEFEVTDTGIGIPEQHLKRIFEDFVTLDTSLQRNASGTGLGLAICKQIVESMKGEIGVESRLEQGSRFWFRVPLKAAFAEQAQPPASSPQKSETKQRHIKVLVVEDNETNRFVSRELLQSMGCSVTLANDGAQGVKAARKENFDLILMDISMPVMNGWDAARAIRVNGGKSTDARIVALTAHVLPDANSLLQDSGMDAILIKPLRRDDLRSAIAVLPLQSSASVPNSIEKSALIDVDLIKEMMEVLGGATFARRLALFEDETQIGIRNLRKFAAAGAVNEAKRLAHKLAGSASLFGAVSLTKELNAVETGKKGKLSHSQFDQLAVIADGSIAELKKRCEKDLS